MVFFDRTSGVARPNLLGKMIGERASEILLLIDNLDRDLFRIANGNMGHVRIAVGPASRIKLLPGLISMIMREFPGLTLQTFQKSGMRVMEAVKNGEADIGLGFADHACRYANLIRKQIFSDSIVLAVRPGHPLADAVNIGPGAIVDYGLALPSIVGPFERWLGDLEEDQRGKLVGLLSDDFPTIISHVQQSELIAAGPSFIFDGQVASGQLAKRDAKVDGHFSFWMIMTYGGWKDPVLNAIMRYSNQDTVLRALSN